MKVILPTLPDPTDIVIQGAVIGDVKLGTDYNPVPSLLDPVLQGKVIGDYERIGFPVPRAMIGQHDWYGINPRQTGPMRQAGGRLEMVDIGQPAQPDLFVDPIQRWLSSAYKVDKAGFILVLYDAEVLGAPEPIAQFTLAGSGPIIEPVVTIPRGAISRSGLAKRTTSLVLPASYGRHTTITDFYQTTDSWFITVTVRDETSALVAGASVYLMLVDAIEINPDQYGNPITQQAITDSNGQCVFQVNRAIAQQLLGYKAGAPDKGGVSYNTVAGSQAVTLYIKDPSTPGGSGGATSWAY